MCYKKILRFVDIHTINKIHEPNKEAVIVRKSRIQLACNNNEKY